MILYSGKRYEALVPETLDLAERAELALNGIGGTIDPNLHYQMYFHVYYAHHTPCMTHHGADITCDPKYGESFPMMRIMCGSKKYLDLEEKHRAELISRIKDGLYWNSYDPLRPWGTSYQPAFDGERKNEDLTNVNGNARMVRALVTWYELVPDSKLGSLIRELAGGLRRIAIDRGDYSYYPNGGFGEPFNYPRSGWIRTDEPASETEGGEGSILGYQGHPIQGLSRWYALTGDKTALDLAGRLTRFCMLPKFWGGIPDPAGKRDGLQCNVAPGLPDPVCISGAEQGHWYSHFHSRAIALRGMLEYGMAANDLRVMEFVQRSYEYTLTLGIPRIGWVNCWPAAINECERCALGDLVALGIRLSDAGLGDYWDNVDAVVRNHLIEQQLVRADLLKKIARNSPEREQRSPYPNQETTEDVIKRSLGNFAGNSLPDSIKPVVMQCCTGNGTQGLYYAWEGTLREEGDSAQINLFLNRVGKLVDVDSYLPYTGKVVIHNKKAKRISIRIPAWVPRRDIKAEVSGNPCSAVRVGNHLVFDNLKPNDTVTLDFPVSETTARYTVNRGTPTEQAYTCTFRGSTLVDISPRDTGPTSYPLYLRDHLRKDQAPQKTVARFLPDKSIIRW